MKTRRSKTRDLAILTLVALSAALLLPAHVQAEPFYQDKTITIIQGRRPGGTGDMRTRALITLLSKHIPGNPTIVSQYMPGAGGRRAGNYLYRAARPDGLTIANIGGGFLASAILGQPGVRYDIHKMIYLGSGNSRTSYAFYSSRDVGLDTLEKVRAASGLRIGAQSVGHDIYIVGRLFAWILGLKEPQFVTGYSGPEMDIAMMRGELDARGNNSDTIVKRNPHWIEKKLVDFHSIMEIPRGFRASHPVYADLPALETFTSTDVERTVLELRRIIRLAGSPYLLPPGVPKERVEILKEALRRTFQDPKLPKAWKKLSGELPDPLLPEDQAKAVKAIPRDPEVIKVFKQIAGPGPLPPR